MSKRCDVLCEHFMHIMFYSIFNKYIICFCFCLGSRASSRATGEVEAGCRPRRAQEEQAVGEAELRGRTPVGVSSEVAVTACRGAPQRTTHHDDRCG
jgi:hypothetical protein